MKHCVGHSFVTWSGIYKWVKNQDFFLLYTAPNIFYIIPTRIINDIEEEKLFQYLA
ncbi:MAG: YcxB family protein [Epsilonproteobacteria bacterium]|nr:YcxB family protein [Campylobacterota bacterium]